MTARPPKVLLIDDDPAQLKSIGDALYASGWHVQLLQHPTLAVATTRSFQPDLVVIDLAMPVLDGREVARSLRAFPDTAGLPFVMLTEATVLKEDMRLLQAGAIDIWRKPFVPAYLARLTDALKNVRAREAMPANQRSRMALIDLARSEKLNGTVCLNPGTPFEGRAIFVQGALHLVRMGPFTGETALDEMLGLDDTVWRFDEGVTAEPQAISASAAAGYLPRVLLVEDQPELLAMGAKQLERAGFKVETATQGQLGFEKAAATDFDLIIADLNMPVLDGWGMLRLLRGSPRTREVPLMFLSAHDDYRETLKAAQAGAHDYLSKTGRSDELIRRARVLTAPRQATWDMLKAGQEVGSIELTSVGAVWLLRILGELECTACLEVIDDLHKWQFHLEKGRLKSASAKIDDAVHSGQRALTSYFGARAARAYIRPEMNTGTDLSASPWVLDEVERACRRVTDVDRQMMDATIGSAVTFSIDPQLYSLFLKVANDRDVRLARALCDEKMPTSQLPKNLGLSIEEVRESLRELVRRSVLTPSFDEPTAASHK